MSNIRKSLEGYALIGKRIQVRRELFGLGDKEFAEKIGITVYMLKKSETGQSAISAVKLNEIAKELEVSYSYFFQEYL
ncbi:MAG: helix-turn-helix domain-containing protein [Rhodomicrobiaceae bacterium]